METILNCYFDNVFEELPRGSLLSRQKRQELIEYFTTVIEACASAEECTTEEGCKTAIQTAMDYHEREKKANGGVCRMGKFHDVLYLAVKMSFDFRLADTGTIGRLLTEVYDCEKTFERISAGAVFGVRVTHFIAGWKSDFQDQQENLEALLFFADHANKAQLTFEGRRFLDIPLTSVPSTSVLKIALQIPRPDIFLLLIQHGANVSQLEIDAFLSQILDSAFYSTERVLCLKYLLRGLVRLEFVPDDFILNPETGEILGWDRLIMDRVLPLSRCGRQPVELKHICRVEIRAILFQNWQLPFGIDCLPLPEPLRDYLKLQID